MAGCSGHVGGGGTACALEYSAIHLAMRRLWALAQRSGKKLGVMFLVEAALGKAHEIATDDHTLTKPPKGARSPL